jgi:uncharacterized protein (DUF2236 family)
MGACTTTPDADDAFAFPPDSILWRVCRERCGLLHGPAAAVLQVAHPKVGAGVRDHSDFRSDAAARLHRTLLAVNGIGFGTRRQADAIARALARRHADVRGRVAEAGDDTDSYTADDPELLMWVLATLVFAAVDGYERVLGPLSPAGREAFYVDMRRFGTYFGLPTTYGPRDWGELNGYYDRMLRDERMGASETSRRVAWHVACPRRPRWLWLASGPLRFVFSEIIPEPVRGRLGFRSTAWSRLSLTVATRGMRVIVPLLPGWARYA